jgi:hypothetical protein
VKDGILEFQGWIRRVGRFENDNWQETSNRDPATLHGRT